MTAPAPHTMDLHPQVELLKRRLMEQGWKTVYLHCVRIEMLALDLGLNWGLEVEPVLLAVWGHDQFRLTKQDELLALAREWGIALTPEAEANPVLLHGPVAAIWMQREMGVSDPGVLEAIRYHTTLHEPPGLLERVLYVADKTDPGKRLGGHGDLFQLAYRDLDAACCGLIARRKPGAGEPEGGGLSEATQGYKHWVEARRA